MLRMTRILVDGMVTLQLEGKLLAPWIDELTQMVDDPTQGLIRTLDLAHVDYIDTAGARLLSRLHRNGLRLEGCSPFVASLIDLHN